MSSQPKDDTCRHSAGLSTPVFFCFLSAIIHLSESMYWQYVKCVWINIRHWTFKGQRCFVIHIYLLILTQHNWTEILKHKNSTYLTSNMSSSRVLPSHNQRNSFSSSHSAARTWSAIDEVAHISEACFCFFKATLLLQLSCVPGLIVTIQPLVALRWKQNLMCPLCHCYQWVSSLHRTNPSSSKLCGTNRYLIFLGQWITHHL